MHKRITILIFGLCCLLAGIPATQAALEGAKGQYIENHEDLRVKVLGGFVVINRTWLDRQWHFNPAWVKLQFTFDNLDGSVSSIKRHNAIYKKTAPGVFVFDPRNTIEAVDTGFHWRDRNGNWITYDTDGRITAYGDRNDVKVSFQYNNAKQLTGIFDHFGKQVLWFEYTNNLVSSIRDYTDRKVQYFYTEGQISTVIDVRGNAWTYTYHPNTLLVEKCDARWEYINDQLVKVSESCGFITVGDGTFRLISRTDPEGRTIKIGYTFDARMSIHTDAAGAITEYRYDFDKNKKEFYVKEIGPSGKVTETWYDFDGLVIRKDINNRTVLTLTKDGRRHIHTDVRRFKTIKEYDEWDNLIKIIHHDGATVSYKYDPVYSNILEKTDEQGVVIKYEYDQRGNLIKRIDAAGLPETKVTEYVRDQHGQIVSSTRLASTAINGMPAPAASINYAYDALGNRTSVIDAEGSITQYQHGPQGKITQITDPNAGVWKFIYNAAGNFTRFEDPNGNAIVYGYDKVGNLVSMTDARGKVTQYQYDAADREIKVIDPNLKALTRQYNGEGMVTQEVDEEGRMTTMSYDADDRLSGITDGRGNVTQMRYLDAIGQPSANAFPSELVYPTFKKLYQYDARNRVILDTSLDGSEGRVTSYKYDKRGQTVEMTDANGKTRYFTYDAFGRTTKFIDSLGNSIEFTWDSRNNLIQVKDFNGNVSRYEYDRANNLLKEIQPLGQTTRYAYDAAGNFSQVIDPNGNVIKYRYDAANRPTKTEVFAVGESTPGLVYTFTHDAADNLTGWSDGTRSASYTYDDNNLRLSETVNYGGGISLTYQYSYTDAAYKKTLQYPDGTMVSYTHDLHGELSRIDIPGEGSISVSDWKWVMPKKITLPGGATRELSYDGFLNLTGLKVKGPSQEIIADLVNKYDKVDQLTEKSLTDTTNSPTATPYTYDAERHLTKAGSETFGVDAAGNRVTHSAVSGIWLVDANNRLIQRGDTTYEYDANGNLIKRTQGNSGAANTITQYKYDTLNRLTEVLDGAGATIAKYVYDPFDNRLIKDLYRDVQGNPLSGPQRTHFLYADEGLIAEADGTGSITTQYGWKPDGEWGTDPIFIKTAIASIGNGAAATEYAYLHNDHIGTPLRATNKAGDVVWRADHNSFGQTTLASNNRLRNNLRFAGQYFDEETGLHYNTRRYYDPQTGRYITQDPIGIAGGWNLYQYANSDPINQVDPTGEWVWIAIRVAITLYDYYVMYKEISENGLCLDWTRLIPFPAKIPRVKWLKKRRLVCSTPCECMGGGRNSFPADTLVHTQDEQDEPVLKPIASLKLGDKVLAKAEWKPEAESLSYEPITDIFSSAKPQRLVHITLDDGKTLMATDGHPFKTTEGWRDAILLKKGGKLLLMDSGAASEKNERVATIKDVRIETRTVSVFNLEVANAHTFFIGEEGILVHNGVIYRVPGCRTPSGKPYIGRTIQGGGNPKKRGKRDGRDRQPQDVIDTYPDDNPQGGRELEQDYIDEEGLENLDNKRNEICKCKRKRKRR